jgi:hypothetical protein
MSRHTMGALAAVLAGMMDADHPIRRPVFRVRQGSTSKRYGPSLLSRIRKAKTLGEIEDFILQIQEGRYPNASAQTVRKWIRAASHRYLALGGSFAPSK